MSILAKEVFSFIEIVRSGSVRRAAERLNISASALSRQLRLLEVDLGVALVARHSNGIRATAQGEQVLAHAERMIELENGLRDEVSAATRKGRVDGGEERKAGVGHEQVQHGRAALALAATRG